MPKRQKLHTRADLILANPQLKPEAQVLEAIKKAARSVAGTPSARSPLAELPRLYRRYRGTGFQQSILQTINQISRDRNQRTQGNSGIRGDQRSGPHGGDEPPGANGSHGGQGPHGNANTRVVRRARRKGSPGLPSLPRWRDLSDWMKAQVSMFCLHERQVLHFTIRFHDELYAELVRHGCDLKEEMRNRISRFYKRKLGDDPWFMMVAEDRTKRGNATFVHFHGSIALPSVPPAARRDGSLTTRASDQIARLGEKTAAYDRARKVVRGVLCAASGSSPPRPKVYGGRSQARNVWTHKPYGAFFSDYLVDYLFKAADTTSTELADRRLAMSRALNQETQRFWKLIREGESAIVQWR
jgi:hypothetical protein